MASQVETAHAAGYSDAEIADFLAKETGLDADKVAAARKAGYSDKQLIEELLPKPSTLGSLARGAVRGITFGFNDELRAGTDALAQGVGNLIHGSEGRPSMGEAYDTSLAANRRQDEQDTETNPVASMGGQLAGAIAPAVVAAPVAGALGLTAGAARVAAPVAGAVSRAAAPVLGYINRLAPSVMPTVGRVAGAGARYAGAGGAVGGVAGFGEGEGGFGERVGSAGTGAAVGAAVAPAIGAAVSAAPAVVGRVAHAFNLRNPQTAADRQIVRALDRSGVSIDEAEARLAAAGGDPAALVDVGGRNTVNLGATAANTPGASMEAADRFVQGRRIGRPDRLMNAGDEAFGGGSGTDVAEATAARRAQRTSEAGPLYEEAFDQPAGMTEQLSGLLDDPIARQGMRQGLEIQRIENATRAARGEERVPTTDPAIHFDDDGTPRIVGVPNMRTIDAAKRGMDSMIEAARDPTTGSVQWTERLRAIDGMRRRLVELADQGNPTYAAARAAWAGPSAQMEATAAGRTALRTDPDIVRGRMGGAPDVQEAYRLGAGRDFSQRVSDPSSAANNARKILEDHQMQARLRSLLSPDQLEALNARLTREVEMKGVENAVSPRAGSQTARLTAGGQDMGVDVAGPWVRAAREASQGHLLRAAGQVGWDVLARRLGQGINPATADAMANRLFQTNPADRTQVIQALRNRLLMDQINQARAAAVIRPTMRGVAQVSGGRAAGP